MLHAATGQGTGAVLIFTGSSSMMQKELRWRGCWRLGLEGGGGGGGRVDDLACTPGLRKSTYRYGLVLFMMEV